MSWHVVLLVFCFKEGSLVGIEIEGWVSARFYARIRMVGNLLAWRPNNAFTPWEAPTKKSDSVYWAPTSASTM